MDRDSAMIRKQLDSVTRLRHDASDCPHPHFLKWHEYCLNQYRYCLRQ
jgi:hypothetical protein